MGRLLSLDPSDPLRSVVEAQVADRGTGIARHTRRRGRRP
jgi:hypothetical protein